MLDAALAEFAAHGIAGARVDRIAASSKTNKAQMYAYFGSKDGLFDVVFAEQLEQIRNGVLLTADDLPGYAVALYDDYLEHPEVVRLATWARLERQPTGDLIEPHIEGHDVAKLDAIADAQARGIVEPSFEPRDLFGILIGLSLTWSPASTLTAAAPEDPRAEHDRRRDALAEAVRRIVTPAPTG